jgi:cell division protein FtsN
MESKHILVVIICICAFLVVVFGVGFWWTLPELDNQSESRREDITGKSYDIIQHTRQESEPVGLEPTQEPSVMMDIGYGEKEDSEKEKIAEETTEEKKEEIEELAEKKELKKDSDKKDETVLIRVDSEKEEYPKVWVQKPQPTKVIVIAPTPVPRKVKRITEYWIQTGAYRSKSKAEEQNEKLIEHGFQAQILTRDTNGVTLYRVRIGPYENEEEANKFLAWIRVIDGMEDSYISEVYSNKYMN